MSFSLSKAEEKYRQTLINDLHEAEDEILGLIKGAEDTISEQVERVNEKIREYNQLLENARSFVANRVTEFQEAYDEKSEKWQEGDAGTAAQELINEWESYSPEDLEEVSGAEIETPDFEAADNLEALSSQA